MTDDSLDAVAQRQVRTVLHRWAPDLDRAPRPMSIDDLIDPILSALRFDPSVVELAADLHAVVQPFCRVQPSWGECLAVARDLLDDHRLLRVTVIDAA